MKCLIRSLRSLMVKAPCKTGSKSSSYGTHSTGQVILMFHGTCCYQEFHQDPTMSCTEKSHGLFYVLLRKKEFNYILYVTLTSSTTHFPQTLLSQTL